MTFDEWYMKRQPEHPYSDKLLEEIWNAAINEALQICNHYSDGDGKNMADICEDKIRELKC